MTDTPEKSLGANPPHPRETTGEGGLCTDGLAWGETP